MSLSKAVIMGTVTRNPEKRFTGNNLAITNFAINFSNGDDEQLLKVVAMGKLAETAETFKKGSKVIVEGRLQTNVVKTTTGEERKILELSAQALESAGTQAVAGPEASSEEFLFEDEQTNDDLIGEDEIPF